jgi:CRISPR-associated protein Cas1
VEPLHIAQFGVFLGKHSQRLVVRQGKETLAEHPLLHVEQLLVSGRGVSFSTDLVEECCARGIPITLLTPGGKPYARVASTALTATVRTRRQQVAAYTDERGARLARSIAAGKLRNQANLLRYFGKYRKRGSAALHEDLSLRATRILALGREIAELSGDTVDDLRIDLLNREGRAGAQYWAAVAALLRGKAEFAGREHRGACDPVNGALNYGYGILQSQVWTAVTLAGLEPFAGFIHVDRPGKPSLVLDLMEEFRQPAVDRPLLAAWGRGWQLEMEAPGAEDDGPAFLTKGARDAVAQRVLQRLEAPVLYQGKQHALKSVIQMQARHVAVAVRGEAEYGAFVAGW